MQHMKSSHFHLKQLEFLQHSCLNRVPLLA
jgi:hypothetical protein